MSMAVTHISFKPLCCKPPDAFRARKVQSERRCTPNQVVRSSAFLDAQVETPFGTEFNFFVFTQYNVNRCVPLQFLRRA